MATTTRAGSRGAGDTGGRAPVFFGWYVVASAFLVMFSGFGVYYSFGAFLDPLRAAFHTSKAEISGLFALTGLIYFSLEAVTGPISDRIGPRRVVLLGALLLGGGLLLVSRANAIWQLYLGYCGGVGLGLACVYVPSVSAVQQWFIRRRGFATGIAVAGIGVGFLVGPPIAAALIGAAGWRRAYAILAAGAVVLLCVAAIRMERSPAARGLAPEGEAAQQAAVTTGHAAAAKRIPVYSTRPFWLLYFSCMLTALGLFVPFAHLGSYAQDNGISATGAAWILGLIGLGSASGRLFVGSAADRLGRRRSLGAAYFVMGVMFAWWLVAHSAWQLVIFSVVFGVAYGGFVALIPALAADYFGAARAGAIIGGLYTSAGIGNFIGPLLAGRIYDATGAYTIAIAAGIVVNILALLCILALKDPAQPPGSERVLPVPAPAAILE